MSLVVVASALPFRGVTVPFGVVAAHWPIIVNLLAGSLFGAWFGAGWATRLKSQTLYRVIAIMLALIAVVPLFGHGMGASRAMLTGVAQMVAGVIAGFGIGIVAALLGVAGVDGGLNPRLSGVGCRPDRFCQRWLLRAEGPQTGCCVTALGCTSRVLTSKC